MVRDDRHRSSRERHRATTKGKSIPEKIGRGLGKLVHRAKNTDIWKRTKQAYQDGLEGKSSS